MDKTGRQGSLEREGVRGGREVLRAEPNLFLILIRMNEGE